MSMPCVYYPHFLTTRWVGINNTQINVNMIAYLVSVNNYDLPGV